MKRIAQSLLALCTTLLMSAWTVPDESLNYGVRFKWGFIDANVGIATLTTHNDIAGNTFTATLSGKSVDLLGHYYEAVDTITGSIMSENITSNNNESLYHESGRFAIETITYDTAGPSKDGPVVRRLSDGKVLRSHVSDYGSGLTIDLLAVFYYMRQIEYGSYTPGQSFIINLSNGRHIESLEISYLGIEPIDFNGESHETYHISLAFSAQGSVKADNMNVWISTDSTRIPLVINGNLSVGHMECHYVGHSTLQQLGSY